MINKRFSVITSYIILGVLVAIASGIIWFASFAYGEIVSIEESLAAQANAQSSMEHIKVQKLRAKTE